MPAAASAQPHAPALSCSTRSQRSTPLGSEPSGTPLAIAADERVFELLEKHRRVVGAVELPLQDPDRGAMDGTAELDSRTRRASAPRAHPRRDRAGSSARARAGRGSPRRGRPSAASPSSPLSTAIVSSSVATDSPLGSGRAASTVRVERRERPGRSAADRARDGIGLAGRQARVARDRLRQLLGLRRLARGSASPAPEPRPTTDERGALGDVR